MTESLRPPPPLDFESRQLGPVQLITCKKTRTCTTKVRERMRETESIESPLHVYVAR